MPSRRSTDTGSTPQALLLAASVLAGANGCTPNDLSSRKDVSTMEAHTRAKVAVASDYAVGGDLEAAYFSLSKLNVDTDGDGLSDTKVEASDPSQVWGIAGSPASPSTSPVFVGHDTDGDGLPDSLFKTDNGSMWTNVTTDLAGTADHPMPTAFSPSQDSLLVLPVTQNKYVTAAGYLAGTSKTLSDYSYPDGIGGIVDGTGAVYGSYKDDGEYKPAVFSETGSPTVLSGLDVSDYEEGAFVCNEDVTVCATTNVGTREVIILDTSAVTDPEDPDQAERVVAYPMGIFGDVMNAQQNSFFVQQSDYSFVEISGAPAASEPDTGDTATEPDTGGDTAELEEEECIPVTRLVEGSGELTDGSTVCTEGGAAVDVAGSVINESGSSTFVLDSAGDKVSVEKDPALEVIADSSSYNDNSFRSSGADGNGLTTWSLTLGVAGARDSVDILEVTAGEVVGTCGGVETPYGVGQHFISSCIATDTGGSDTGGVNNTGDTGNGADSGDSNDSQDSGEADSTESETGDSDGTQPDTDEQGGHHEQTVRPENPDGCGGCDTEGGDATTVGFAAFLALGALAARRRNDDEPPAQPVRVRVQ